MRLNISQNHISPFVASFSYLAPFQKTFWRATNVHKLFVLYLSHTLLWRRQDLLCTIPTGVVGTAAPVPEITKPHTAPRIYLCNLPETFPYSWNLTSGEKRGSVYSVWATRMQNEAKATYWHLWSTRQRTDLGLGPWVKKDPWKSNHPSEVVPL